MAGAIFVNLALLDEDDRLRVQGGARVGGAEVRLCEEGAGRKWLRTAHSSRELRLLGEEALEREQRGAGVVLAALTTALSAGRARAVCGTRAANLCEVAARAALLRHQRARVALLLLSPRLHHHEDEDEDDDELRFAPPLPASLDDLRAWGAELIVTDEPDVLTWIDSVWPEVPCLVISARLPAEQQQEDEVELAAATNVEEDVEVDEDDRKRGRDDDLEQQEDAAEEDGGKHRRVDAEEEVEEDEDNRGLAAMDHDEENEELEINILDESAPVDGAFVAEKREQRVQVPSNEEESQEGTAREGPDLTFDLEASEKSMTEAVEGRRPHHLAAAVVHQERLAEQVFVAPEAGLKLQQDDLDMEEINQLIGEELASL